VVSLLSSSKVLSPVRAMDASCCLRNNHSVFAESARPPRRACLLTPQLSASRASNKMFRPLSNLQNACATLRGIWCDEYGQGISEYAVVMSMVILLTLVWISFLSSQALDTLRKVAAALQ